MLLEAPTPAGHDSTTAELKKCPLTTQPQPTCNLPTSTILLHILQGKEAITFTFNSRNPSYEIMLFSGEESDFFYMDKHEWKKNIQDDLIHRFHMNWVKRWKAPLKVYPIRDCFSHCLVLPLSRLRQKSHIGKVDHAGVLLYIFHWSFPFVYCGFMRSQCRHQVLIIRKHAEWRILVKTSGELTSSSTVQGSHKNASVSTRARAFTLTGMSHTGIHAAYRPGGGEEDGRDRRGGGFCVLLSLWWMPPPSIVKTESTSLGGGNTHLMGRCSQFPSHRLTVLLSHSSFLWLHSWQSKRPHLKGW